MEDGSDVDGESEEIIYDFTQNLITMLGSAEIRNVQGTFSGAKLVYDLDSQNLLGDGGVRLIIQPDAAERAAEEIPRGDDANVEPSAENASQDAEASVASEPEADVEAGDDPDEPETDPETDG